MKLVPPQERTRALAFWEQVDAESAAAVARQEYDRLINAGPTSSSQESLWRLRCLKTGALNDHGWASPRVVREVLSGGISSTDQLLGILSETDRGVVVRQLLPELAQAGPSATIERRNIVELAPVVAAERLLDQIVKAEGSSSKLCDRHCWRLVARPSFRLLWIRGLLMQAPMRFLHYFEP